MWTIQEIDDAQIKFAPKFFYFVCSIRNNHVLVAWLQLQWKCSSIKLPKPTPHVENEILLRMEYCSNE